MKTAQNIIDEIKQQPSNEDDWLGLFYPTLSEEENRTEGKGFSISLNLPPTSPQYTDILTRLIENARREE